MSSTQRKRESIVSELHKKTTNFTYTYLCTIWDGTILHWYSGFRFHETKIIERNVTIPQAYAATVRKSYTANRAASRMYMHITFYNLMTEIKT